MSNEKNRFVALILDLSSTSPEDAVRQFISAIGIYGMGALDFQVYEDDDDEAMIINGREAMRATMNDYEDVVDPDERQEAKEDEVRSDLLNDNDEEDADDESPG